MNKVAFWLFLAYAHIFWPTVSQLDEAITHLGADVFTIYDGQRHLVLNWDIFLAFGYHDYDVKRVGRERLESFPLGPPLLRYNGLDPPVKGVEDGNIFIIREGQRRAVPNMETFLNMGYSQQAVNSMELNNLQAFSLGPPLPQLSHPLEHPQKQEKVQGEVGL